MSYKNQFNLPLAIKRTVYSLGYQQRDLEAFIQELSDAGVDAVVDVREVPWSRKRGFSKRQLSHGLAVSGIEYVHARFAGNPKELRRAAPSHAECLRRYEQHLEASPDVLDQLDEVVLPLLAQGSRVCLVCYERHPDDCHRSVLLRHWVARLNESVQVLHLGPDGAKRLIKE